MKCGQCGRLAWDPSPICLLAGAFRYMGSHARCMAPAQNESRQIAFK
jgi:hypothetical protein